MVRLLKVAMLRAFIDDPVSISKESSLFSRCAFNSILFGAVSSLSRIGLTGGIVQGVSLLTVSDAWSLVDVLFFKFGNGGFLDMVVVFAFDWVDVVRVVVDLLSWVEAGKETCACVRVVSVCVLCVFMGRLIVCVFSDETVSVTEIFGSEGVTSVNILGTTWLLKVRLISRICLIRLSCDILSKRWCLLDIFILPCLS